VVSQGYAPFEQYHSQGNQGPWSDLYALSGVLYWMVTGHRPHEATARIRADTMPAALQCADRNLYRPAFLAAIDWALAPIEDQRPQSVGEWRAALLESGKAPKTQPLPKPQASAAFDPAFLEKLEAALAQHLGPIANVVVRNAAKTALTEAELVQLLAQEISEEAAKAAFEKKFSGISRPAAQPASAPRTDPATSRAAARFALEVLARAEQRLGEYLGAVARVVVKRAAVKARDERELYLMLADEIEDKEDRKAFIRKAVSMSQKP
jgi:hypothetical protein